MSKPTKTEIETPEAKAKGVNQELTKTAKIALRREKISELMLAGYNEGGVRRITEYLNKLGYECKKSTVANDISFILAEAAKNTVNNLEEKREMVNARLESLIGVHWLDAQKGNVQKTYLVRTLLKDQRELYGLNAAQKLELSGNKENPVNFRHSVDLSNLSKEELLLMEALVSKTAAGKNSNDAA